MTASGTIFATRYRLLDRIGSGGMATVWRAIDLRLQRDVAVKVLRPQFADDPEFVARFEGEARHAASVSHPNVATVFDTGVEGEEPFIVMELVDGPSVADILRVGGPMAPGQAVDVAASAARALASAHRRGLIHRDVKPANILVGRDGRVRLADFGIARALTTSRVTVPGTVLGSIPYLSPEQARGEEASAAGDVFSLGVVLYEMLTGRLPWTADGPAAVATVRTTEAPIPLAAARSDVPAGLQRIVSRALKLDPATRYPSARSFAESLETWARKHSSELAPEPDLAETATLVAAAPFAGAGGTDDALVSPVATGMAVAAAAFAHSNPNVAAQDIRIEPERGTPAAAVLRTDASPPIDQAPISQPPDAPPAPPTSPVIAVSPRMAARARREATRPRRPADDRSRERRTFPLLLAALIPAAAIIALVVFTTFRGPAGGPPAASGEPGIAAAPVAEPTPSPSPSRTSSPTPAAVAAPTASPRPTASPSPTPEITPEPTPPPTPRPTKRPVPRTTPPPTVVAVTAVAADPARTVAKFYDAVEAHDWDTAIALWSPSMRRRYPPQEWLIDRFKRTTRIDLTRLRTASVDRAAGRARVAVSLTEYRTVEPSPRSFSGSWDLVVVNGRWRLNDPNF